MQCSQVEREESRSKDTTLFHSCLDREGRRCGATVENLSSHTVVECSDNGDKARWKSKLSKNFPERFTAYAVKGLLKIVEDKVEGDTVFLGLL